jgi:NAD(P)-dependent dehydrogenase (short-subunit alcohol dehydrogenase family)
MPSTLAGKRAVVTGAGRGIGRSIALALAGAGADVAVTARTTSELEQLVTQIQALGCKSLATPCDVTNAEQVKKMAQVFIDGLGGIDILVNNAGNASSHKFLDHPDDLWQRMLAINLTSVYSVSKAFVPTLIGQRWGRIINIASIASRVGDSISRHTPPLSKGDTGENKPTTTPHRTRRDRRFSCFLGARE